MALHITRDIAAEFSGQWYTLMVDETTDLSNIEQMVVCLRRVTDDLAVHEEVIGLYSLESTSANAIVSTVKDVLLRMNMKLTDCRGQCYDGASNIHDQVLPQKSLLRNLRPFTHIAMAMP